MGFVTTQSDAERIAQRYPPPALPRRLWIALAALIVAVGVPWMLWSGLHAANPAVAAKLLAFDVRSDSEVDVTITVERPDPSVAGVCTLKAQAVSYDTVGQLDVELPPGTERLETLKVVVRTFKPATSVSIVACRAGG